MAGWPSSIRVFSWLGEVTEETYLYFFVDDVILLASSECHLHHALEWFAPKWNAMRLRLSQFASVVDRMCIQMQDSWEGMEMQRGDLKNSLSGVEWSSSGCWPRNQQKREARSGAGCETNQPWWLRWIWMIGMEGLTGDHWKLCPLEAEGLCKDPLAAQPEINEGVEDLLVAVTGRWSCREFRRLGCRPM